MKKQFIEGKLEYCKKGSCEDSCCDNDQVEEWANEYFAFHERLKDHIESLGIEIRFIGDRARFRNCFDKKRKGCKLLLHSLNKDVDPRPIDCKIYPYVVDWKSIDFDKKAVSLFLWEFSRKKGCPLAKNNKIPEIFRKEVENIIKRDFAVLFYGARFNIKFINKVGLKEPYKI